MKLDRKARSQLRRHREAVNQAREIVRAVARAVVPLTDEDYAAPAKRIFALVRGSRTTLKKPWMQAPSASSTSGDLSSSTAWPSPAIQASAPEKGVDHVR